ncbi:MAG: TIGR00730 family Rossman fold protein [Planctomycetia bacterium]|nr:TIGR00730 family Rossman fold protein [Planctomycetia bacterium]
MRSVCVFCGSASGGNPVFAETARALGTELARRSLALVYGGGRIGLMGEVAVAAKAAGGTVVGVIPELLAAKEIAYDDASELIVVNTMHTRKAIMADRADAFLALPGGFGTLEELFEILTWAQLGIHAKPVGLLDVAGFYSPLLAWLDQIVSAGLLKPKHRDLLIVRTDGTALLDALNDWRPPTPTEKWMTPAGR